MLSSVIPEDDDESWELRMIQVTIQYRGSRCRLQDGLPDLDFQAGEEEVASVQDVQLLGLPT